MGPIHTTVLLHESIDGLSLHPHDIYLDGTLGSGGHSLNALEKVKGDLKVIGLDKDAGALARSKERLSKFSGVTLIKESYRNLDKVLDELQTKKVNAIMLDLGLSSDQFETSGRGFSFKKDEPLLMTFSESTGPTDLTAEFIVNNWEESSLADIIYGYGEERYARKIARKIVEFREGQDVKGEAKVGGRKLIKTTNDLVDIINSAVPASYRRGRIHPATRTFQALRITVNDELNTLKDGLRKGFERLAPGGRMAIISFHSLEDRIVKHFYKEKADEGSGRIITKKPITPTDQELVENPRSRSAKLRIIEKI